MKTDEVQHEYITETEEALELLGKGYNLDPVPPNEFVSTISGYTLAPDVLINEYGYVSALVWGVTWRFCQMADGVCRAGLEKIAARLGMSERTIIRHLDTLCEGGYLFDTTPNLKNKPHIYADTRKIQVHLNISVRVTESQRQGDRESVEESTTTGAVVQKNIYSHYESNIGVLTAMIADSLDLAEKEYPADWVTDAIRLAVENNKRNWRYCEAILKRWKESGKDDGKGKPKTETKDPKPSPMVKPSENEERYVPRPAHVTPPKIKQPTLAD